jgi:glycosyltransferase involved in cell wall biosynthesis
MNVDPFRKLLFRQVSKYFDSFILVNSQDSEWEKFISRKHISNIKVIPNGIASNLRIPVPVNSTDREIWVIGTISRLEPERLPWSFLEVFAKIDVLLPDRCRFILAGEGSAKDELKKLAKRAGIHEKISMPGLIYDPTLVLSELDIYIALNIDGHTGIAGLEAVLAGIPVVGIQLSPTYLDGEVDWIWSNQDTTAVAQKIVEYIENPHNLSAVIGLQHSKVFDEYSVHQMMENYLQIYKNK